jgi:hypothetical protein
MKKIFILLSLMFLLNGCFESMAVVGTTVGGASNGRVIQTSLNSAVSYGIKKQTGKSPLGHALTYAKEKNPEKKKEPCLSFIDKTNSEICAVIKKQISSTQAKIKKKKLFDMSLKELTSSLQSAIKERSKIKYLDQ